MRCKICGLRREADIDIANACRPDYIGFVFAEGRRRVEADTAAPLRARLASGIVAVGVFVAAPIDDIVRLVERGTIDAVQLHGDEDARYLDALRSRLTSTHADVPIIKALRMRDHSLDGNQPPLPLDWDCDFLLLDAYAPHAHGGTGIRFAWDAIPDLPHPYFLAGGIDIDTIQRAATVTPTPYALDISSGVETDGWKDARKVHEVVEAIARMCV